MRKTAASLKGIRRPVLVTKESFLREELSMTGDGGRVTGADDWFSLMELRCLWETALSSASSRRYVWLKCAISFDSNNIRDMITIF